MIKLRVNGVEKKYKEGYRISDLVEEYAMPPKSIVTELNREIIFPHERCDRELKEGDVIEILRAVAGG